MQDQKRNFMLPKMPKYEALFSPGCGAGVTRHTKINTEDAQYVFDTGA